MFVKKETEHYDYPQLCMFQDEINDNEFLNYISNEEELIDNPVIMYIHIPFCKSICVFCNYYKVPIGLYSDHEIKTFVDAMISEIRFYASVLPEKKKKLTGVQFGGGTPTILPIRYINQILAAIKEEFDVSECKLFSMEGTMASLIDRDFERVSMLAEAGINRISFGVQSFSPHQRKKNGLVGDIDKFEDLCKTFKKHGIHDYNIDLMYNYPDQTPEEVIRDINRAFDSDVVNIDLYSLNIYPETTLYHRYKKRGLWKNYIDPESENRFIEIYRYIAASKDIKTVTANIISKKREKPQETLAIQLGNNRDNGGTTIGIGPSSRGNIDRFMYKNAVSMENYITLVNKKKYGAALGHLTSVEEMENRTLVMFPYFGRLHKADAKGLHRHRHVIDQLVENNILIETADQLIVDTVNLYWNGNIAALFYSNKQKSKMIKSYFLSRKHKLNLYNQDKMQIK